MAKVELEIPEFQKPPTKKKKAVSSSEKKIVQVTQAKTREQRLSKKLADALLPSDVQDIKSYLIFDVVIPQIKDSFMDLLNMAFYGEARRSAPSRRGYYTNERVSYNAYYKSDRDRDRREQRTRRSNDIPEIICDTRNDAQDVIEEMNNLIDEYDNVSVGDLNQIVGITGTPQDEKFGWYDISSARVRRCADGYLVDLPRPRPID